MSEEKRRKPNRLPEFDYGSNGAYFVTICTDGRKRCLSDIVADERPALKKIGTIAEEFIRMLPEKYADVSVDKYVIMPDHIHMILFIHTEKGVGASPNTLGKIIGWYKYNVTKRVNAERIAPAARVFQRSYYDHVIRGEQDYLEIWDYIDGNPQKWFADRYL